MKNLYEIEYTKEYVGTSFDPYKTKVKLYQIPASSELNAAAVLGQMCFDDDYEIDIVSIKTVKVNV